LEDFRYEVKKHFVGDIFQQRLFDKRVVNRNQIELSNFNKRLKKGLDYNPNEKK